ncbi:MAG: NAD(P)-dependent oxidoreductase [Proteobacteria bacterium]|nr:NAD(P)-dependent oxidoreductase [Pseudomonadota bacterium]
MSGSKVAFIGLGVMGYPMAGHLAVAGHDVTVYNRTTAKADQWVGEHKGRSAPTPAEAAKNAAFVFMCVGNDADLRAVSLGDGGVLAGMSEGAILIDHTTVSAGLARELDGAARSKGVGFLDAPVSGGQAGAVNGALTIMVGGHKASFDQALPVMDCYAKRVRLMGEAGAGQLTKAVNQICIAGVLQGLAEGLNFAQAAGLDADAVVDVISQGAAQSWQMDNRAATMAKGEFEFGFAVDWMRKDLAIALNAGRDMGASLPLTALVDQFYADVQAKGGQRWDTSSLITRLR